MSRLSNLPDPTSSSYNQSPTLRLAHTADALDPAQAPSLASPLEGLAIGPSSQPSPGSAAITNGATHADSAADSLVAPATTSQAMEDVTKENSVASAYVADNLTTMTAATVKQEPIEPAAPLGEEGKPSIEDTTAFAIKHESSPLDRAPPAPSPSPAVLPTTERSRPPPKSSNKKAAPNASKRAAPKKRKADTTSKDGTPMSQRSGTPASRAGKPSTTKSAHDSPARSLTEGEEDDDDEDDGVFCICRGPDDHTWMIGCDGDCEDWFHGRCVGMKQEDADLVDKYICPNCAKKGIGVTTWKPMCRLDGCRKPARASGPLPSKYCSDEHGREFMRQRVLQKSHRGDQQPAKKKRHVDGDQPAGTLQGTAEPLNGHQAYLRGGLLEPGELKALTDGVKDSADFKRLGESVLPAVSHGASALEDTAQRDQGPEVTEANDDTCVPEERTHLEAVLSKAANLRHRLSALRDKEKLLGLVKLRASQLASELGKSAGETKKKDSGKDMCGFDNRLSWSDPEFDAWRLSPSGQAALVSGHLEPLLPEETMVDGDGDAVMHDASVDARVRGVCQKKRCERHKAWYKLHQQEIAYDQRECDFQLERLGQEARGVQERAILKKLERPRFVAHTA